MMKSAQRIPDNGEQRPRKKQLLAKNRTVRKFMDVDNGGNEAVTPAESYNGTSEESTPRVRRKTHILSITGRCLYAQILRERDYPLPKC